MSLHMPLSSIPIPRTGLAAAVFAYAAANGTRTTSEPHVGDLINWRYDGKTTGHEEQVIEVHDAGWVMTEGYNVTVGTGGTERDGGGVAYKWRNLRHPLGRLKYRGLVGFSQ